MLNLHILAQAAPAPPTPTPLPPDPALERPTYTVRHGVIECVFTTTAHATPVVRARDALADVQQEEAIASPGADLEQVPQSIPAARTDAGQEGFVTASDGTFARSDSSHARIERLTLVAGREDGSCRFVFQSAGAF